MNFDVVAFEVMCKSPKLVEPVWLTSSRGAKLCFCREVKCLRNHSCLHSVADRWFPLAKAHEHLTFHFVTNSTCVNVKTN